MLAVEVKNSAKVTLLS